MAPGGCMVYTNRNNYDVVYARCIRRTTHDNVVVYCTYYACIQFIGIYAHTVHNHRYIIGMSRTHVYVLLFSLDPYLDKLAPKKKKPLRANSCLYNIM